MKPNSDIYLLILRITVDDNSFNIDNLNSNSTLKNDDVKKKSQLVKKEVDSIIKEVMKKTDGTLKLDKTVLIESSQGCIVSTIIASFIAGLGVELVSPYVKPIVDKIINRIKSRFGKETNVESNMIALDDILDSKTTTIIINGDAKIICNKSIEDTK